MLTRRATYLALIFAVLFAGYIATTETASAVGSAADAMCNPVQQVCGCGMIPNPKGGCMGGANMFMCPCQDVTSGFTTSGQCIAANKCLAQSTGGGSLTSMSQLMQTLGQLLQSLGQSSGSGGGGGSGGGPTGCTTYTQTSNPNNTDPCQYYVPGTDNSASQLLNGTGTTDSTVNDLISSLIGSGNSNSNNNSNSNSNTTASTTTNTSGSVIPNDILATISNVANPQNLTPGTSATVSQSAFGNAPGVTGDIQVLSGNRVTMLASNRDIAGNKQTSGFYGFNTSASEDVPTVYTQACAARQWASNFISTIIPVSYLDNLCASHGYAVGPPQLQPATPPPAPTPAPAATSAPQYLGPMKADIWISPASISSGSRTSLFWNASGVLTCQISSPSGVLGSALSGTAAVGPLTQSTTYSIACQSATSSVSNQATVTVQ